MSSSMRGVTGGDWWSIAPSRRTKEWVAAGIAIGVHVVIAGSLLIVNPARLGRREAIVEMEVNEKPPPPPEIHPERPPPPPPAPEPAAKPRIVPRRVAVAAPKPPPAAPPPTANQTPPKANDAPPVFGVTMSSVVSGDNGMAIPIGNTLMTKDRTLAKAGVVPQASGSAAVHAFVPVADIYIADPPRVLHEVNSADIYPPEAYKMGIEGKVQLKVSLDSKGNVVQVRIVGKAGHGFDEAARDALRQFRFSPARTSDGQAVDYSLTYTYVFDMSH